MHKQMCTYTYIHAHVCIHRVFSPDLAANKSKVKFVSAPGGGQAQHLWEKPVGSLGLFDLRTALAKAIASW